MYDARPLFNCGPSATSQDNLNKWTKWANQSPRQTCWIRVGTGSHRRRHSDVVLLSSFDPLPPLLDEHPVCSAQAGWRDLPDLLGLEQCGSR